MRRKAVAPIALTCGHALVCGVFQIGGADEMHARFILRQIDVLSLPGFLAVDQGRQNRRRAHRAGGKIGIGAADPGGGAIGPTGDFTDAGQRGQNGPIARRDGKRSGLSLHARTQHDEVGLDLSQALVIQPPLAHGAWGKTLNHHVAHRDQTLGEFYPFGVIDIEGDAELAVIVVGKRHGAIRAGFVVFN